MSVAGALIVGVSPFTMLRMISGEAGDVRLGLRRRDAGPETKFEAPADEQTIVSSAPASNGHV